MFSRISLRKTLPSAFQIIKVMSSAEFSKQISYSVSSTISFNIIGKSGAGYAIPFRCYSEKGNDMTVDYEYVKKACNEPKVLIVDVREPEEVREHGQIPNSINIPLGSVTNTLSSMTDEEFSKTYRRPKPTEESEIIFYCMIGKRSGMAQQNALNSGYKNVKNYLGSWTEWGSKQQKS